MATTVNYLIWQLIKPSSLILLAAILGTLLWRHSLGGWCRRAAAVMIVVFGLLPTAALLMRPLETRFEIPAAVGDIDGIVVLAGAELNVLSELYGQPQLGSMGDRLTTFLMLAAEHPDAALVHSGAAETARALILGAGIDAARVTFDERPRNTCQSATRTRDLVDPAPGDTWLLVTSSFHLPRAVACSRAAGWEIVPYPADFRRGEGLFYFGLPGNLEDLDLAAHEWLGLLYYRLRGFTRDVFPSPRRGE